MPWSIGGLEDDETSRVETSWFSRPFLRDVGSPKENPELILPEDRRRGYSCCDLLLECKPATLRICSFLVIFCFVVL